MRLNFVFHKNVLFFNADKTEVIDFGQSDFMGRKKKIQLEYLNSFVFPRVWNLGVEFDSCLKFDKLTL